MNFSVVAGVVPVKLKINLQPMVHLKKALPFITEIITFNRIEMVIGTSNVKYCILKRIKVLYYFLLFK